MQKALDLMDLCLQVIVSHPAWALGIELGSSSGAVHDLTSGPSS